jgi:hypothetical protein
MCHCGEDLGSWRSKLNVAIMVTMVFWSIMPCPSSAISHAFYASWVLSQPVQEALDCVEPQGVCRSWAGRLVVFCGVVTSCRSSLSGMINHIESSNEDNSNCWKISTILQSQPLEARFAEASPACEFVVELWRAMGSARWKKNPVVKRKEQRQQKRQLHIRPSPPP